VWVIQTSLKEWGKAHEKEWTMDPVKEGAQYIKAGIIEVVGSIQND